MRLRTAIAVLMLSASSAASQQLPDPHIWLEEVEGDSALAWVEARNRTTMAELTAMPVYDSLFGETLEILNSDERIAYPDIMGGLLYNFWQDAENPRGVWRRTTWESYLAGDPDWEELLDLDALSAAEDENWAWHGASCLAPDYERCLVWLSPGGSDADVAREFDLRTKRFIDGGFHLPLAKQGAAWVSRDVLLVASDFGPGTMTESGYPRTARLWTRGTPLSSARLVFEGAESDVGIWPGTIETRDANHVVIFHRLENFFEGRLHLLRGERTVAIDIPVDADPNIVGDQLVVYVRTPWQVGQRTFGVGSVISIGLDEFLAGERDFEEVLQAGARSTVLGVSSTRDYLLVSVLDNVRGRLWRYHRENDRWNAESVPAPDFGSVFVASTSPHTNGFFFGYNGFTQPPTLYLAEENGDIREVKSMPAMFDAEGLVVEQLEATSRDGTRVPYFVVRHEDQRTTGDNPTLLYAYGGFEVSMTPSYGSITGKAWLERGGVYALANIRGGGEFGPAWHRAAQRENRQRAFDDFIAVAEDLVARGITSPRHLGLMGGSNGGLLVGTAMTQRPDLFGAVVAQVPLLDMRRYHTLLAGASWMAEYGDPDEPDDWRFISQYSPYHNVVPVLDYPRPFFYTTTRDDRVHPGHARKMAARMEEQGHPMLYFENTEGGHGAGVTPEQRARMYALTYSYLWSELGRRMMP
ncbi:MAG TPA: prolyl oligopeptidase family serine peptidase [Longimicrobiales bacterium]